MTSQSLLEVRSRYVVWSEGGSHGQGHPTQGAYQFSKINPF